MPGPQPKGKIAFVGKLRAAHVRPLQGNAFYTAGSTRVFVTNGTASPAIIFISGCRE